MNRARFRGLAGSTLHWREHRGYVFVGGRSELGGLQPDLHVTVDSYVQRNEKKMASVF